MADQLDTGIVHVNDQALNNDAYAPFGGTRAAPGAYSSPGTP
jgi:benzaldehyde dehydrogenase (NAD)